MLAFRQRVERKRASSLYLVNRTKLTPEASRALEWAERQLGREIRLDRYTLPQVMAAALRSMYLNASNHETEAGVALYIDPTRSDSTWAHCDSTVGAYMNLLGRFDVATRRLTLWHAENETHAALEYFSPVFRKWVYYDPLYGAILLTGSGVPAGVQDIQGEISQKGFDTDKWRFQAVRIYDLFDDTPVEAVDSGYGVFEEVDYDDVLRNYLNVIAIRREDVQQSGGSLPGSEIKGRWLVIDNTALSPAPDERAGRLIRRVVESFSTRQPFLKNQHFELSIVRGVSEADLGLGDE